MTCGDGRVAYIKSTVYMVNGVCECNRKGYMDSLAHFVVVVVVVFLYCSNCVSRVISIPSKASTFTETPHTTRSSYLATV